MPQEVIQLNVRKLPIRILLIIVLLVAGIWSYFALRWYIGNMLAEYFNPTQSNFDVAKTATSLAPKDPLTHWRLAQVSQKALPLDQQGPAIAEYEMAVSLSPYDYRFWMTLGTAQEQAGNPAKAEAALRRAVTLAPAYSYPHWYLGNLLLRNGRYDEAFNELRLASQADPELQSQLFNLTWQIYSSDPQAMKTAVGDDASIRGKFAQYLIGQKRYEDGLRLWNGLSADEKKANKETGEAIMIALKNDLRFNDTVVVWNELMNEKFRVEVGQIFDGSFEEPVSYTADTLFGWQVKNVAHMQVGIDPDHSHSGSRSLRLLFQVRTNLDTINVSQLVPVQPNTEYDFEFYVATEKLETGSAPEIQIIDASTGTAIFSSPQAPGGTNHWNRINFSFKSGDKTEALTLKIARVSCASEENPVCPIFGSVWYDDFTLKRRN